MQIPGGTKHIRTHTAEETKHVRRADAVAARRAYTQGVCIYIRIVMSVPTMSDNAFTQSQNGCITNFVSILTKNAGMHTYNNIS